MKKTSDRRIFTLRVTHEFKGSHSLEGFLEPHFHLFKVSVEFQAEAPIKSDRVVDMIEVQNRLEACLAPLQNQYLNTALGLSPTSENLALWVWDRLEERMDSVPIHAVGVVLCDLEGRETGRVTLSR